MVNSREIRSVIRQTGDHLAAVAEERAHLYADVNGEVALRMFADAIRRTNAAGREYETYQ